MMLAQQRNMKLWCIVVIQMRFTTDLCCRKDLKPSPDGIPLDPALGLRLWVIKTSRGYGAVWKAP